MFYRLLFLLFLLLHPLAVSADDRPLNNVDIAKIDQLLSNAISQGLISGGVVLIGNHAGTLFERSYGKTSNAADARPTTVDTIFDLASLTKVIATTPSILKLAEEGKISLVDPLSKWYPEFNRNNPDLLILNLLTHTSGLDDFPLSSVNSLQCAVDGAAAQKSKGTLGTRFKYADINFILLADAVKRITGTGLDLYATATFFAPLGMKDTFFTPAREDFIRCASTLNADNAPMTGQAQDYVARQLGGVAGHAGLFSTAGDLARFCRMILNGGEFEGRRILSRRTVEQMTAPYFSRGGKVIRGLGWDIDSPYSSPRGSSFSPASFGHTGYSGSSIWIDPANDTFVVLLTSRLEYRKIKDFNHLRGDLSTIAAELFALPPELKELSRLSYE